MVVMLGSVRDKHKSMKVAVSLGDVVWVGAHR